MSRRTARAGAGWLFGFATTIFLVGMWGRSVVVDTDALTDAAAPLADSAPVVALVTDWLETELGSAGLDEATSDLVVEEVMSRPAVTAVMDNLIRQVVLEAASPSPTGGQVDVARVLAPAVPEISATLATAGVAVAESQVSSVVSGLDPLEVRSPGSRPLVGPSSRMAFRLGTAAVVALLVMSASGWAAISMSHDRLAEARSLLSRVALGAISFGILLRVGSWVLDPEGGRAPFAETVSRLAGSKWIVPLMVGLATAAAAGAVWAIRRVRRAAGPRSRSEAPTPPAGPRLIRSGRG